MWSLSSSRRSDLFATRINGIFGQKCIISGTHILDTFSNESRESTEKQIRITSKRNALNFRQSINQKKLLSSPVYSSYEARTYHTCIGVAQWSKTVEFFLSSGIPKRQLHVPPANFHLRNIRVKDSRNVSKQEYKLGMEK